MCDLCTEYDKKVAQFQRVLTYPLDQLTKDRIAAALRQIETEKPQCADPTDNDEMRQ